MKTLDNVNRYPHPGRPAGAVCYVTAIAKDRFVAAKYWLEIQARTRRDAARTAGELSDAVLAETLGRSF